MLTYLILSVVFFLLGSRFGFQMQRSIDADNRLALSSLMPIEMPEPRVPSLPPIRESPRRPRPLWNRPQPRAPVVLTHSSEAFADPPQGAHDPDVQRLVALFAEQGYTISPLAAELAWLDASSVRNLVWCPLDAPDEELFYAASTFLS